jgi:tetratricopeptide (TPR) repeat protein
MKLPSLVVALAIGATFPATARADATADCLGESIERRIEGCTAVIERGGGVDLSTAYTMRALAYSLRGRYDSAIRDYDAAINMKPDSAAALNNRAWVYFRWGKAATGISDVEKAIGLNPTDASAVDTRAHIRQALGQPEAALRDYHQAMRLGGSRRIKQYQCGLTEQGLYNGDIDGTWRPSLQKALERCVLNLACDPLPADEHCRATTS